MKPMQSCLPNQTNKYSEFTISEDSQSTLTDNDFVNIGHNNNKFRKFLLTTLGLMTLILIVILSVTLTGMECLKLKSI